MAKREVVARSDAGRMLNTIKAEIEKERKLMRPNYSIRVYMVHAPWLGQVKLFEGLINDYNNGAGLFLIREPYGRINHLENSAYLVQKFSFLLNFSDKTKDLESFKKNCVWDEPKAKDPLKLAEEWNKYGKVPEGKVLPELYAAVMFDNSLVYGVVDERIALILNENLITKDFSPLQIERVLIEKAFSNTIAIMDDTEIENSIAVIDSHWRSFYKREADLRKTELIIEDCSR